MRYQTKTPLHFHKQETDAAAIHDIKNEKNFHKLYKYQPILTKMK